MRNIFLAAACMLAPLMAVMAAGPETITVQVFNYAGAPASVVREAMDEAGWIFERAGIDVRWGIARPSPASAAPTRCARSRPTRSFSCWRSTPGVRRSSTTTRSASPSCPAAPTTPPPVIPELRSSPRSRSSAPASWPGSWRMNSGTCCSAPPHTAKA